MEKMHKTIFINAPREKVWDVMLSDATYRDWTTPFCEGSYYEGSWEEGAEIRFYGPNPEKPEEKSGMVSRIAESRKPEFVSIEHLGMVTNGVEDYTSEMVTPWLGAHENYTFTEKDGGTELSIGLDITEQEMQGMAEMWDKALARLKELAEG